MATSIALVEAREVLRCEHCSLTQFRTSNSNCRRCHKPLDPVEMEPSIPGESFEPNNHEGDHSSGVHVARAVKDLRRRHELSQRELAARMGVPRTYISKIENEKAVPTLGSLARLAKALQVHISVLLRDDRARLQEEAASLMEDPFLVELLPFVRRMDGLQRSIFLNQARELATGRRRTA
jgi:transcriptional regulator with XRE-family HTH domain